MFKRTYLRFGLVASIVVFVLFLGWNSSNGFEQTTNLALPGNRAQPQLTTVDTTNEPLASQSAAAAPGTPEPPTTALEEPRPSSATPYQVEMPPPTTYKSYIEQMKSLFLEHRPNFEPLRNYTDGNRAPKKAFDDKLPVFTNEELGQYLEVPESDKDELKRSHQAFVNAIPDSPEGVFNGTGVVYVSGGKYMPIMLISIRMLRRVSPTIPVEVFIGTHDEYEPDICEKVLPDLGAKCIILQDVYGTDFYESFDVRGYQFKALAILASSFENVIFIDSDNMPIQNVEQVVQQEPFLTHKYILWPDFWFRTTSPHYYDIAGIKLGKRVRGDLSVTDPKQIPQADLENALPDKSSESGQIVVSKKEHFASILLTTYYNLHGFSAYYPLFTQGSGGEGDKETFIAGALALNKTVYQVKEDIHPSGRFTPDFEGSGMMQALPLEDYENHVLHTRDAVPRILFIHFNVFKLNPRSVFEEYADKFTNNDDDRVRFLGKPSDNLGWYDYRDIELYMWFEAQWATCDMAAGKGIIMKDWNDANVTELCDKTKQHVDWLLKTHNW